MSANTRKVEVLLDLPKPEIKERLQAFLDEHPTTAPMWILPVPVVEEGIQKVTLIIVRDERVSQK
jgi:hypothetical protein